jgi:hypothetical protein
MNMSYVSEDGEGNSTLRKKQHLQSFCSRRELRNKTGMAGRERVESTTCTGTEAVGKDWARQFSADHFKGV